MIGLAYGEVRMTALVPMADALLFVAFVDCELVRRIISLSKANRREVNHYVNAIEEDASENADN